MRSGESTRRWRQLWCVTLMSEPLVEPCSDGFKLTHCGKFVWLIETDRIPRSRTHVLYNVVTEGIEVAAGELTFDEAKEYGTDLLAKAAGRLRRLPAPEVTPFTFGKQQTDPSGQWLTDGVLLMLRTAVRRTHTATKLFAQMSAVPARDDLRLGDVATDRMVNREGEAATAKARVSGMVYSLRGPVVLIVVEKSAVTVRLDARRLALLGHTVEGTMYAKPNDVYAPVAFKTNDGDTVGLIMPLTIEASGEELLLKEKR